MAGPAHSSRIFLLAAVLLLAVAAFLRLQQIERRPFHADEAVQAYQTWQLLLGDGYTYDPADKHGPFLYYAAAGFTKITGGSAATLSEKRLRTFTLLAGLGTLALLLANARRLGRGVVLTSVVLLAVAPLAIIYDTYFIQEAWFCFFTWALFFAVVRWWGKAEWGDGLCSPLREQRDGCGENLTSSVPALPRRATSHDRRSGIQESRTFPGAVLIGTLAGLMQATKETSVLHFAALGVAVVAMRGTALGGTRPEAGFHLKKFNHLLIALLAALFVYVLFYSAFFTRWVGVVDGVRSYFNYAARPAGSAHDQPWHYYFSMLWPHASGGVRWGELLLLIAALLGAGFAFTMRASATLRSVAVFTLTLLLLYSAIPYKTPWLLLTPYVGLTLLAGYGVARVAAWLPEKISAFAALALGLILIFACVWQNFPAISRYANDDRNPYVYQPTSADLARLTTTVAVLPADRKIAVVSPDHAWPLPWYWRDRGSVGYFAAPPANLAAYDLVLFDSRLDAPLPASVIVYGLRPNVILWCTTP